MNDTTLKWIVGELLQLNPEAPKKEEAKGFVPVGAEQSDLPF